MITKILDALYAVWQSYEGCGDDADNAFYAAYIAAIETVKKEGYAVVNINGKHYIKGS